MDVGVAVLLESSDHRLLLTHRAEHMRTFPGIWVPPGGHVGVCYMSDLERFTLPFIYFFIKFTAVLVCKVSMPVCLNNENDTMSQYVIYCMH